MNYLMAFLFCIAGTLFHLLGSGDKAYWLMVSDANVALWLFVAWAMDKNRRRA